MHVSPLPPAGADVFEVPLEDAVQLIEASASPAGARDASAVGSAFDVCVLPTAAAAMASAAPSPSSPRPLAPSSPCTAWVLNKPGAMNALSLPMATALRQRYADAFCGGASSSAPRAHVVVMLSSTCASALPQTVAFEPGNGLGIDVSGSLRPQPPSKPKTSFFCAGGDVRSLYEHGKAGNHAAQAKFFAEEYALNHLLGTSGGDSAVADGGARRTRLTQVSLLDGVTMGGGAGLSLHGRFRVATENTVFAMPECSIGFHPDIGASWFLPRLLDDHRHQQQQQRGGESDSDGASSLATGLWLGLTGARLQGRQCVEVGVATHYCSSNRLGELVSRVYAAARQHGASGDGAALERDIATVLDGMQHESLAPLSASPPASPLQQYSRAIEHHFGSAGGAESVSTIMASLQASLSSSSSSFSEAEGKFLKQCLDAMRRSSPVSLAVTLESVMRGSRAASLRECLEREYCVSVHFMRHPDFYEGVRAQLIDKDRSPSWSAAHARDVSAEEVAAFFRPCDGDRELKLPELPGNDPPQQQQQRHML